MDWKRVKTILILALIAVNAVLGYKIYDDQKSVEIETLDSNLVLDILSKKDVIIDPTLLDVSIDIENVNLQLQTYDIEKSDQVFRSASSFKNSNVNLVTTLNGRKELSFETEYDRLDNLKTSDEVLLNLAYDLIADLSLATDDLYLIDIGGTDKKRIIKFGQKIGGYPLKDSYTIVKYNNQNLLEFKRVWYNIKDTSEIDKNFYKPEYALYEFIGDLYDRFPNRQKALTVEDISLVYQVKPLNSENELNDYVVSGEARIYWQITTSDSEAYLFNAVIE